MRSNKTIAKSFSFLQSLIASLLFISAGIIMITNPAALKTAFLVISIIILEVALIRLTIYFAVRPYEKKIKHFYSGIGYWIAGIICLTLYFVKADLIFIFVGLLLCAEGVLGIFKILSSNTLKGRKGIFLGIDAGVILAGILAMICAVVLDPNMIASGTIIIFGGILMIFEAVLFTRAKSAAKAAIAGNEKFAEPVDEMTE